MYDKTLDTFKAVAEEGSFTRAAGKLFISHTAVIKQINALEERLGVRLFERAKQGVTLTNAGQTLYAEALQLMRLAEQAVERVRAADLAAPKTLRVGTSPLFPCHRFMDLWIEIRKRCAQYSLKIISFDDDWNRLSHIGREFDCIIGVYNPRMDDTTFGFLPVGEYHFCIAAPLTHTLAKRRSLSLRDLDGQLMMMMRRGSSSISDRIRARIETRYPGTTLIDVNSNYDVATFNQAVERNCLLLSVDCWDRVHPDMKSIPLTEHFAIPYGIVYPRAPTDEVREFLSIIGAAVRARKVEPESVKNNA